MENFLELRLLFLMQKQLLMQLLQQKNGDSVSLCVADLNSDDVDITVQRNIDESRGYYSVSFNDGNQEIQSQETTSKFDGIEDALDVETSIVKDEKPALERVEDTPVKQNEAIKKDYEYTRGNLYSLIDKGQEAVDGILELSQQTDSPRAYEVAGNLIKNVADATDKLIDLQKKMQELEEGPKGAVTGNVTNNTMFVGSTADLAKFLKQKQKEDKQ